MHKNKRIMGIDYGHVRIGVSLSDSLLITASPFAVIERKPPGAVKEPLAQIKKIAEENDVFRVVMGLPKNLDNTEGKLSKEVSSFAEKLSNALSVEVVLHDERLTSVQAEKALIAGCVRREKRKERIDGVAAALILQNYLEML